MASTTRIHILRVVANDELSDMRHRVVDYLNVRIEDYSRSGIKKMVKAGLISVNETKAQTSTWIKPGDVIDIYKRNALGEIWKLPISIRFEDDEMAVVHKPAGIPTSGYGKHTLTSALPFNIMLNSGPQGIVPHPVHRLDRDTEGLVIVAKSRQSSVRLGAMLAEGKVQKTYRAWVHGTATIGVQFTWDIPVGDQSAITRGTVLAVDPERNLSLLELYPITGRTHQLRKHCAFNEMPILGDNKYGIDKGMRLKLIAYSIKCLHPMYRDQELFITVSDKHLKRFNKILI